MKKENLGLRREGTVMERERVGESRVSHHTELIEWNGMGWNGILSFVFHDCASSSEKHDV